MIMITEPALLIRISQKYSSQLSKQGLYEVTRGVWKLGERRNKVKYAFSVANGIVKEVYKIRSWHSAGTTAYATRSNHDVAIRDRWEFIGEVAPDIIRNRYINKSIAHYFSRGAQNPIMYLNL